MNPRPHLATYYIKLMLVEYVLESKSSALQLSNQTNKKAWYAGCAQNVPDATPPTGKIQVFRKIVVTLKPVEQL